MFTLSSIHNCKIEAALMDVVAFSISRIVDQLGIVRLHLKDNP